MSDYSWIDGMMEREIKMWNAGQVDLEQVGCWLAVDTFRKLAGSEREYARWFVFETAGRELAEYIEDTYPHYWQ